MLFYCVGRGMNMTWTPKKKNYDKERAGPSCLIKVTQAGSEFVLTPHAKEISNLGRIAELHY